MLNSSLSPFYPPKNLVTARITSILSELVSLKHLPKVCAPWEQSVLLTVRQHCTLVVMKAGHIPGCAGQSIASM